MCWLDKNTHCVEKCFGLIELSGFMASSKNASPPLLVVQPMLILYRRVLKPSPVWAKVRRGSAKREHGRWGCD